MTKKRVRTLYEVAHTYASRRRKKHAAKTWSETECGTYWWGLLEGYQAGVRAGRRKK
jgi:hypothetical protein